MLQNPAEVMQEDSSKVWTPEVNNLTGVQILLAEDGLDNRELIQDILQRVGAKVETAENGRIAVEMAVNRSFDLILMDMNMPEMDGYQATGVLRDRGYRGPILALTANAMAGDSERCRLAGCDEYLTKPIDRVQMIKTIAAFVATKAAASRIALSEETGRSPVEAALHDAAKENPPRSPLQETANVPPIHKTSIPGEEIIVSKFINQPEMTALIQRFVGRIGDQLNAMRKAMVNHEHEELRSLAHQTKGAGGSYGYPQLTDACKVLEDAARARNEAAENAAFNKVAVLVRAIENACLTGTSMGTTEISRPV
jgi:CheY-like chemotaxis protein